MSSSAISLTHTLRDRLVARTIFDAHMPRWSISALVTVGRLASDAVFLAIGLFDHAMIFRTLVLHAFVPEAITRFQTFVLCFIGIPIAASRALKL